MAARTRRTVTERIEDQDELEDQRELQELADANEGVTIFDLSGVDEKRIEKIHVFRKDPPEGFLAEVEPTLTEQEILSRWGGSIYRLEGKNAKGRIVKVTTLTLAGDPSFVSEIFEVRWRRMNGLKPKSAGDGNHSPEQLSMKDVLILMEERDAKRREEERDRRSTETIAAQEREDRRRRDEEERDERRRKDEAEREERRKREQSEREDKDRRLRQEEEDRRRQQHREDMERQTAQTQLMMQQQGQMFQHTVEMMKTDANRKADVDPVAMLTKGIELAVALKGEGAGEEDVMTAIAKRLPDILREVRTTGGAVVDELRKGKGGRRGRLRRQAAEETEAPAEAGEHGEEEEKADRGVTMKGPMAEKIRAIARQAKANGKDPIKEIDRVMSAALVKRKGPAPEPTARRPRPGRKLAAAARAARKPKHRRLAPPTAPAAVPELGKRLPPPPPPVAPESNSK